MPGLHSGLSLTPRSTAGHGLLGAGASGRSVRSARLARVSRTKPALAAYTRPHAAEAPALQSALANLPDA